MADLGDGFNGETYEGVRVGSVVDVRIGLLVSWPRRRCHDVAVGTEFASPEQVFQVCLPGKTETFVFG